MVLLVYSQVVHGLAKHGTVNGPWFIASEVKLLRLQRDDGLHEIAQRLIEVTHRFAATRELRRDRDGQRQQHLRILRLCPGYFSADTDGCTDYQSSGNAGLDEYDVRLWVETDQQSVASDPMGRRDK